MIILEAHGVWKGWHYWKEGAERGYPELAEPHYHWFEVRVRLLVTKDREVEFIAFGEECARQLSELLAEHRDWSCEAMAKELLAILKYKHDVIPLSVHVMEEGLSGAIAVAEGRLIDALLMP